MKKHHVPVASAFVFFLVCALCLFGGLGVASAATGNWQDLGFQTAVTPVGDVYEIATAQELAWIAQRVNSGDTFSGKTVTLTDDIDLGGRDWTPIGIGDGSIGFPLTNYFSGVFDGDGYEVTGMRIVDDNYFDEGVSNTRYAGLFGVVSGDASELRKVGVTDFEVSVDRRSGAIFAGGLAGWLFRGSITSAHSTGSLASSSPIESRAGGIVGQNGLGGSITSAYSNARVFSSSPDSYAGGLAGHVELLAIISSSYATGAVTSYSSGDFSIAGGLVGGSSDCGEITSSYATGDVEAIQTANPVNAYAGGLFGYLLGSDAALKASYAWGAVSVQAGGSRGGLAGCVAPNVSADKVKNNNWRRDSIAGGVNYDLDEAIGLDLVGIALIDAKSLDVAAFGIAYQREFEARGWDFENTWCYSPEDDGARPHLRALVDAIEVRSISADIGGVPYEWEQQNGGLTWVCEGVPFDADLSAVDLNVLLWLGANVDKTTGLDLNEPVELTVTAPDGKTTKTYTVTTYREEGPEVVTKILDALPENARAVLTEQSDGKYAVDIYIPFDSSYNPSQIASIYVDADNISIVRVHWLDEDGNSTEIPHRQAGGHELRINGTVESSAKLADVVINKITVRLYNDGTRYTQTLGWKLSEIPGGRLDGNSSSGVGCTTGAGALALVVLGVALIRRRRA